MGADSGGEGTGEAGNTAALTAADGGAAGLVRSGGGQTMGGSGRTGSTSVPSDSSAAGAAGDNGALSVADTRGGSTRPVVLVGAGSGASNGSGAGSAIVCAGSSVARAPVLAGAR